MCQAFRAELKSEPEGSTRVRARREDPGQISVQVHEESLSEIHLVLPASEEQLSEADLEMVCGGGCWADEACPTDA
jgi:hypothetical protein